MENAIHLDQFVGRLENHLTVETPTSEELSRFHNFADATGLRFLHIVLARGSHSSQPMVTQHFSGKGSRGLNEAQKLREELQQRGFSVSRVKIETDIDAKGVPQTPEDALQLPHLYFEHHIKLQRPREEPLDPLLRICGEHGAHLSRNANKQSPDDVEERYATIRHYRTTQQESKQRCAAFKADLRGAGFCILRVESEFCIDDSNVELDSGWLPGGGK